MLITMCQTVLWVLAIKWIAVEIGSKSSVPLLIYLSQYLFFLVCFPLFLLHESNCANRSFSHCFATYFLFRVKRDRETRQVTWMRLPGMWKRWGLPSLNGATATQFQWIVGLWKRAIPTQSCQILSIWDEVSYLNFYMKAPNFKWELTVFL